MATGPNTIAVSARTQELDDLLRSGQQLEIEHRWADALTQYEDGLRRFPDGTFLQCRYDTTRLHYDLQRCANDRSFRESLGRLSLNQALDLYAQVLMMIDAHYADNPNWQDLVERGTNDLEVALGEQQFTQQNVPQARRSEASRFAGQLRLDSEHAHHPRPARRPRCRGFRRLAGGRTIGHVAHDRGA